MDIERLKTFKDHPFRVEADGKMAELKESIEKFGIINPLIVRPMKDGSYEIISGHRRKYAAEQLGSKKVPVIVRVMKDGDAIIAMVEAIQKWINEYIHENGCVKKEQIDALRQRLCAGIDPNKFRKLNQKIQFLLCFSAFYIPY